jgi:N-acetylglucosaminyldiphosphoundecaprenol N-acetyl-beta-D-mannosaminyltransferase
MLSIIIPVRDRHESLLHCLDSIAGQNYPEGLEILVVDDGSTSGLLGLADRYSQFDLKIIRQVPLGVAAARNRGIEEARGEVLLFVDSDCILEPGCLANLLNYCRLYPYDYYQLSIMGDERTPAGKIEHLRVAATLQRLTMEDGHIPYINTSGFAVCRSCFNGEAFFDARVRRGEDSLILARLTRSGRLPRYVPDARVRHCPTGSLARYTARHLQIGFSGGFARQEMRRSGTALMKIADRFGVLRECRTIARHDGIAGYWVMPMLIAYLIESVGRVGYRLWGFVPGKVSLLGLNVDILTRADLIGRCMAHAEHQQGLLVTYATAWTLVCSRQDTAFREAFKSFHICYPDGAGVVFAAAICRRRRANKVTVNDFYRDLFQEAAYRHLRVALVGGEAGVAQQVAAKMAYEVEGLNVCFCSDGYSDAGNLDGLTRRLLEQKPHIVLLAMGQPLQEEIAARLSEILPSTVFWCVGGLFDVISGRIRTPPKVVRKMGLEWLFRLVSHPYAHARRYLLGIPLLFYYILHDVLMGRRRGPESRPENGRGSPLGKGHQD